MNDFALLERELDDVCRHTPVTGVALAVVRDARVVYAGGFGDLARAAVLPVASLSKPVFAYAVLDLVERGLLDLDTPLAQYLPEPYLADEPHLPLITARHALSHTTGFPNWRDSQGLRAACVPGSAFYYSTEGLLYLQAVVDHLTGEPLDAYLRRTLLEPLGMLASAFVPEDLSQVQPHLPAGLRAYGAIGLHTTAEDYARFLIALLDTPLSGGDVTSAGAAARLSPAGRALLLTPQIPVGDRPGLAWGLGWGLQQPDGGEPGFWHWGARRMATRNFALGLPASRAGIVILSNHADGLTVCERILRVVLPAALPSPALRWLVPMAGWSPDGRARNAD